MDEIRSKMHRIFSLVIALNPTKTQRQTTGEKPSVFIEYLGHTADFAVRVCEKGWCTGSHIEKSWDIYMDNTPIDKINAQLDEIIGYLECLKSKWGDIDD